MPPVWRDSVQVVLRIRTSISPPARIGRPVLGVDRQEFDLVRIVEDRRGDRPAFVDVEALVHPLIVRQAEAGKPRIGAADQLAARLDLIERARVGGKDGHGAKRRSGKPSNVRSHDNLLIDANRLRARSPKMMRPYSRASRRRKSIGCHGRRSMLGNGPNNACWSPHYPNGQAYRRNARQFKAPLAPCESRPRRRVLARASSTCRRFAARPCSIPTSRRSRAARSALPTARAARRRLTPCARPGPTFRARREPCLCPRDWRRSSSR